MHWSDISIKSEQYSYEYFLQEDICRLCWTKNAGYEIQQNVFENSLENPSFYSKLKYCLNIDINNVQPNRACVNCFLEIERFYYFKKFCQESDKQLREILHNGPKAVNDRTCELIIKPEPVDTNFECIDNEVNFYNDGIIHEFKSDKKSKNIKFRKKRIRKLSPTYCKLCCLDLKTEDHLLSHNKESHGIENDGMLFKCFGCDKRFKSRKSQINHEANFCKGLKDGYKCSICERYLPKRCMYEYHMRNHRYHVGTELPEYIFKCYKCQDIFKSKELLKNHDIAVHSKEKTFVCDICGRVFTRQDYLHKHKLIHTGVKRHQCPHCDFKATQRSSLIVHIRKHTGERPYSCDMCEQRCISSSNLLAHRRRHLGVKQYECTICNKKFAYKISLDEHISTTHVRSEMHPCEHCGATYTRVRGLRRHLAAKHGKQQPKEKENNLLDEVTEITDKIDVLKNVECELKDGENVLLLKHHDGNVYMV